MTTSTVRDGSFAISGQQRHDREPVGTIQRRSRLVGEDGGGVSDNRTRDRDPLLLAGAELAGKCVDLVGKADGRQGVNRLRVGAPSSLAAHLERQSDVLHRRQRGKQMIGLEDEADMAAPQIGELFGTDSGCRLAE